MARPKKQTVDYFPHDTDASHRKTLTIIQNKYGNDGYSFWFRLLELLGKTPGHYYAYQNVEDLEFLCAETHQKDTEIVLNILATLDTLNAIDHELYQKKIIWCQKFVDGVAEAYKRAKDGVPQRPAPKGVNVSNHNQTVIKPNQSASILLAKTPKNATEMPQTKLDYTILNNNTSKEGRHKKSSTTNNKVSLIFSEMKGFLGYKGDGDKPDPIPNYGKEGSFIKKMLNRGFTIEQILGCWKSKVIQRHGDFVSMVYVNEDIGKKQIRAVAEKSQKLPSEEEIAESIRRRGQ